jgi:HEAT repeat protein
MRGVLLQAMAVWYTPETLPILFEGLRDQNPFVRHKAIEALGSIRDERAIRALADCLGGDSMEAAQALCAIGPAAERVVIEYAKHPNAVVRYQAIKVLGRIGTRASVPVLSRMTRMGDPMMRWAAEEAMRAIRDRRTDREEPAEEKEAL